MYYGGQDDHEDAGGGEDTACKSNEFYLPRNALFQGACEQEAPWRDAAKRSFQRSDGFM